jgi:hypothetical protein
MGKNLITDWKEEKRSCPLDQHGFEGDLGREGLFNRGIIIIVNTLC